MQRYATGSKIVANLLLIRPAHRRLCTQCRKKDGMARTKRTEEVKKTKDAMKSEEVEKKIGEKGEHVTRRAKTKSYRK
ncbi:hypothetical protein Syun_017548 [Stephania yunnanensis]|uniref:Uncharacterized protein n=1 Tax=Stephania yunnanensis TaxID=152371 RepID=A0AAP0J751_9MAGN